MHIDGHGETIYIYTLMVTVRLFTCARDSISESLVSDLSQLSLLCQRLVLPPVLQVEAFPGPPPNKTTSSC